MQYYQDMIVVNHPVVFAAPVAGRDNLHRSSSRNEFRVRGTTLFGSEYYFMYATTIVVVTVNADEYCCRAVSSVGGWVSKSFERTRLPGGYAE